MASVASGQPLCLASKLRIVPWPDPVLDAVGFDARSAYVERFWLGILGPSALLLLRHLARRLEEAPAGFELDVSLTARSLGLSARTGRNAPLSRCLERCVRFGLLRPVGPETMAVRRHLGPLSARHLQRLPLELQAHHRCWPAPTRAPQKTAQTAGSPK